jgi:nicotinate-nucleotide adenylyltransferase
MIGILGGTFDPVHYGHLRPALEVKDALGLSEIRLVPCHLPPHRPPPLASARARADLLAVAIAGHEGFVIDERELDRPTPSWTIDTLAALKQDFPARTLCLLTGMDAFIGLPGWHRWRELNNYCHLVVMTRPGAVFPDTGELGELIARRRVPEVAALRSKSSGMLFFQPVTQLEISGTRIRGLLQSGRDASFLVPERVLALIREQGLYTSGARV